MVKRKGVYWAVYDEQTNQYLETGKNSKTLKQAVDELWDWTSESFEEADKKKVGKWTTAKKREWLESTQGFTFEKMTKKLKEDVI